jgi:hypothetical protein
MSNNLRRYLLLSGIAAHLGALLFAIAFVVIADGRGFGETVEKVNARLGTRFPLLTYAGTRTLEVVGLPTRAAARTMNLPDFPGPDAWPEQGVMAQGLAPQTYDSSGIPQQSKVSAIPRLVLSDAGHEVSTAEEFIGMLKRAQPGETITLAPGVYDFRGVRLSLGNAGTAAQPIVVRAKHFGTVTLNLDTREGFYVDQPYWVFENLQIRGSCKQDSRCEHAFHVVGLAHGIVIRNNEITDFNAALKVNGLRRGGREDHPDHGLVQNNTIYLTRPRNTANPTNLLNINSGNGWVVSANFLADAAKTRGDRISYAAFMKGNSEGGIFERNLVLCHWKLQDGKSVRVGLSFGGGGTGAAFCRNGSCEREHTGGVIRNNIIARCPVDVGIYLNRAARTSIHNNFLLDTQGIDVRFATSSATLSENLIDGRIRNRDGGKHRATNNLITGDCNPLTRLWRHCDPAEWLRRPDRGDLYLVDGGPILGRGAAIPRGPADFCGRTRSATADIGPIQYSEGSACLPNAAD